MQIEDYMLVSSTSESDVTVEVRKRMYEGWQPWQSPGIAHSGTQRYFCQALVKCAKPVEKKATHLQMP
jgi:hypothetical protein